MLLSRIGRLFGGTVAVAAAAVGLALAPVALAASLPKAVDFWGMQPDALAARPAALGWTTDLGPSFNGTRGSNSGRGPSSNISWSSWDATGASGNGDLWVPRESGQSISWKRYPAKLSFSAPATLTFAAQLGSATVRSALVFTRVTVSFTGAAPAHWSRSASFPLKEFSKGFYGFDFPR
jgi:hypothetical protein